ncbi:ABC transporter ATP-binding protein [Seleniivibrio woodruffii]|uniref:ABC transporter ATP-binding protein n=1 Tax=Seleniivibrio woodruffii TaxID=1078050 RepID=UPI00240A0ADC|nr:ABC transporter ATP-binding protein [Seleniivibrio woodruffii]
MLDINNVGVSFGGVHALSRVTFTMPDTGISALIGPNGAGKTTLFNVITGFVAPKEGTVKFAGKEITGYRSEQVFMEGISRTFQNLNIIPELTLRENMYLGFIGKEKPSALKTMLRLNRGYWKETTRRIEECMEFVNVTEYADMTPGSVPYGVLKNFELGRAVMSNPKLLLLDEPAAGLNLAEKENLAAMVRKIQSTGVCILMVEHDMQFISSLAEFVVCLNFGQVIATGTYGEIRENKEVLKAYLGDEDA